MTKSNLRAAKDELKVAKDSRSEEKKVTTMEKDQNALLLTKLEQVKMELVMCVNYA